MWGKVAREHNVYKFVNSTWYECRVPKSLHNKHRKPYTSSNPFNCGMSVAFLKVYAMNTERLRRRGCERLRRQMETAEERETRSINAVTNAME